MQNQLHHPKKPSLHRLHSPSIPDKKPHGPKLPPAASALHHHRGFPDAKQVSFSSASDSVSSSAPTSDGSHLAGKLASWLSYGIFTAFFVSLDRCSCVKLDTIDLYEPVPQQPLLFRSRSRVSRHRRGPGRDQEEEEDREAEGPSS